MSFTESTVRRRITLVVLASLTTILNVIEIAIIIKKRLKSSLKPYEKLLLSLAFSDLLVALTAIIFKVCDIVLQETNWLSGENFTVCLVISVSFSISNLLAITVDRFLAVKFPINHRILMTNRRINAAIFVLWFLAISASVLWGCFILVIKMNARNLFLTASCFIVTFGIAMIVVYLYIIHVSLSRKTLVGGRSAETHRQVYASFFSQEYRNERNIFYTCCLVTMSYIACAYPFAIEVFINKEIADVSFASKVILFLNSATNPLVYFFKGFLEKRVKEHNTNVTPKE